MTCNKEYVLLHLSKIHSSKVNKVPELQRPCEYTAWIINESTYIKHRNEILLDYTYTANVSVVIDMTFSYSSEKKGLYPYSISTT